MPVKYSIVLTLKPLHLCGFESVDLRRRFGLDDAETTTHASYAQTCVNVSEEFARTWFGNALRGDGQVDATWLIPGELIVPQREGYQIAIAAEIPPERAQTLYMRARLARVQEELESTRQGLQAIQAENLRIQGQLAYAIDAAHQGQEELGQLKDQLQRLKGRLRALKSQRDYLLAREQASNTARALIS